MSDGQLFFMENLILPALLSRTTPTLADIKEWRWMLRRVRTDEEVWERHFQKRNRLKKPQQSLER
jgi:hypothetical protein